MKIGYNKTNPADVKIAVPDSFICYILKYVLRISLSPNFLSNLLNKSHLLPLIIIS
ncbi:Uncharacterised protein [uncultured Eubacterium sp.]|nr:Uncharacterised protein [uncultured Eubacterium sp.]